jgi:hypothetical protein
MALMSSMERVKMEGLPGEEQKLHVFFATADYSSGSRPMSVPGNSRFSFFCPDRAT